MRIGQVARRTGLSVATIRYYERLGLVPEVSRSSAGYRQFDGATIRRLRFVRRARALGFTLEEIRALLELRLDDSATTADVRQRAGARLDDIEARIADLERMRDALRELTSSCCRDGPARECPILEALEGVEADPGG